MRILALETSSRTASVAMLEDDRLLAESLLDPEQRTARSFAPTIAEQLAAVGWRPDDVELLAVTRGPGSFTGLRIGITAAKTFAYVVGAEVMGVNTLKVIAFQVPLQHDYVHVVLDAQRQQLFAAPFRCCEGVWEPAAETRIVDNDRWLRSLAAGAVVTGPGLERLVDRLPRHVAVIERDRWVPRAGTVGRVGYLEYRSGKRDDLWKLVPQYFRKSAAEEKFEAKRVGRQSREGNRRDHRSPEGNQAR